MAGFRSESGEGSGLKCGLPAFRSCEWVDEVQGVERVGDVDEVGEWFGGRQGFFVGRDNRETVA